MKKSIRLFSLLLAALFVSICFVSCGQAAQTEFFIGSTGPLTGDASVYGNSVNRGAQMAIDEINNNGGLNGVKFKFEMIDDKCTEEGAINGYTSLLEKGMQISIGSVTSGCAKAFGTRANADKVLFMTPSASADNVIGTGDYGFRVCFGDPQQGTISANELIKTYNKIGVIYDTSDAYPSGIYAAFKAEMERLGKAEGTDFVTKTFDADNKKDFNAQVSALQEAGCDVIYLPIYYTEAALIIKAAAAKGFEVPVFGNDGFDGLTSQITAADNIKVSIKYTTPFDVTSTETAVKAFVDAYKAKYNEDPTQFAADGYDAVMIIYNAMKAAGISDPKLSAEEISTKVKDILTNGTFTYTGLTGNNMSWEKSGSCNKEAKIVAIQ